MDGLAGPGDPLDQLRRSGRARVRLEARGILRHPLAERRVREQAVDGARQLVVVEAVGGEPDAETGLVEPLRVVT